jgi:hypothetical protein
MLHPPIRILVKLIILACATQVLVIVNLLYHTSNDLVASQHDVRNLPTFLLDHGAETTRSPLRKVTNYTSSLLIAWNELQDDGSRIFPRVCPRRVMVDSDQVTVTVHAGTSKFQRLLFSIERWGGPVSAAVYVKSEDDIRQLLEYCHVHASSLQFTDIHVLMEKTQEAYPHNLLRQAALNYRSTDYFLTLDVDFVTPPQASRDLDALVRSDSALVQKLQDKTLMVLPAFAGNEPVDDSKLLQKGGCSLPRNKQEAIQFVQEKHNMTPFHTERFSMGHGPTNYDKWFTMANKNPPKDDSSFYLIDYGLKYEPYVLGYSNHKRQARDDLPPDYWAGFRGYGFNKWTWLAEAYFSGFQFGVLRDFFVVHMDHPRSPSLEPNWPEYKLFLRHVKQKFHLSSDERDDIFSDRKKFKLVNYTGPENIPRLVGWRYNHGSVSGRIFQSTELFQDREYIGTALIVDGEIENGSIVTAASGKQYYLSGEALEWWDDEDDEDAEDDKDDEDDEDSGE